ncbi:MAG: dephospho-CoA kinase [Cytophagales bacterium]|nr:MAG: dephospho-CoA kinase [Rhodothermaeota bacterium MED-G19]
MNPYLIGITGGIGSGKSTVSQIISHLGYKVYDSDARAHEIINENKLIKDKLIESFGSDIYQDSKFNKKYVSKLIFNDESAKTKINSIVHPEVINDFKNWVKENKIEKFLFKESALLFESSSYKDLDKTVYIYCDKDIRIERIKIRDPHRTRNEIEKIINNQISSDEANKLTDYNLVNDEKKLLLPKVVKLLGDIHKDLYK